MGFEFNIKKSTSKLAKKAKVELDRHQSIKEFPEYYSYIDRDGNEQRYLGIVSKASNDSEAFGKVFENHDVKLDFHPEVKAVVGNEEYFTFIDENGEERIYRGLVEYDLSRDTYIGKVTDRSAEHKVIQIFPYEEN